MSQARLLARVKYISPTQPAVGSFSPKEKERIETIPSFLWNPRRGNGRGCRRVGSRLLVTTTRPPFFLSFFFFFSLAKRRRKSFTPIYIYIYVYELSPVWALSARVPTADVIYRREKERKWERERERSIIRFQTRREELILPDIDKNVMFSLFGT